MAWRGEGGRSPVTLGFARGLYFVILSESKGSRGLLSMRQKSHSDASERWYRGCITKEQDWASNAREKETEHRKLTKPW